MKIVTYQQSRDLMGRFVPNKRKVFKLVFALIVVGSLYGNYRLLKAQYNFSCGVNNEVVGYFTTKQTCDDLYTNWIDSSKVAAKEFVENNKDLYE